MDPRRRGGAGRTGKDKRGEQGGEEVIVPLLLCQISPVPPHASLRQLCLMEVVTKSDCSRLMYATWCNEHLLGRKAQPDLEDEVVPNCSQAQ